METITTVLKKIRKNTTIFKKNKEKYNNLKKKMKKNTTILKKKGKIQQS